MKKHITGALIGVSIGTIDSAVFLASGEALSIAAIITALSFWTTVGWAVHVSDAPMPSVLKGILIAWFINFPWVIEFVITQGQKDLLMPMLIMATVFGAVIGFASQLIRRRVERPMDA